MTTVSSPRDRVAVHGTPVSVVKAQARAAGLPLTLVPLPDPCPNAAYEKAVGRVVGDAEGRGVEAMAFGDLFLRDIREYREGLLEESGVRPVFPVWGRDTGTLAQEIVEAGVEARIVSLDPDRVDPGLLGAAYDEAFLRALDPAVDPCGENGEFHTVVTGGPMLDGRIGVVAGDRTRRDGFLHLELRVPGEPPAASSRRSGTPTR